MQYIEFTWDSVEAAVARLVSRGDFDQVDLVVAIEHGGIIPAALIQRHCSKAMFTTIHYMMSRRDVFERLIGHKRIMFVDDINDTGNTFNQVSDLMGILFPKAEFPWFSCVSLIKRKQTKCAWASGGIVADHPDWEDKDDKREREERDRGV